MDHYYYIIYKPYRMLSQFTQEQPNHITLAHLDLAFPKDVYPVGRLDADSEGLLLLSNDNGLKTRLLNPKNSHWRYYWVQVEGQPQEEDLEKLRAGGLSIKLPSKKRYACLPAKAELLAQPPILPERDPPVRFRANIPTSWLRLGLKEGKNRQVRKMTAAIGFPTLRLVRQQIGQWSMPENMQPSDCLQLDKEEVLQLLK
ncbi:pseudouridine synthase [Saprospira sp. CCB-QB6]|uniref:pseudouridine synthase n=1 Tax=Saprospira sp. CCB-QB6 TaxID=3023936 RepID=UPI00234A86DA|nr:pseudouridine synthase [Saprospira sp. CCB-QB6]WCL81542.1 pseudouridine synthase [Saprospira sp. CCB-QB6]